MLFIFKEKKLVVDAFTTHRALYDLFPPKPSVNFLPDWWKALSPTETVIGEYGVERKFSTMKKCEGFIDLYKSGFMIPMWADLIIRHSENNYTYEYSNGGLIDPFGEDVQKLSEHARLQMGYNFQNYHHAKISVPWLFTEKTGVKFHLVSPIWSNSDKWKNVVIVPGSFHLNFVHRPNVNCFLLKEKATSTFNCGDPLIQIIPQSEKELDLRVHLVSAQEYGYINSNHGYVMSFINKYKNLKKFTKKNSSGLSKCPFHY